MMTLLPPAELLSSSGTVQHNMLPALNSRLSVCCTLLRQGVRIPVFVSGTIVDNSGRTLSGQTNEAFWNSISNAKPLAVGLNCALGATDMKKYVDNLSQCADCYVFCYPNAGLPNAMGGYDQKGPEMAEEIRPFCECTLHGRAQLQLRVAAALPQ
jgi:methionine synthase I (cobalamin-dependent)